MKCEHADPLDSNHITLFFAIIPNLHICTFQISVHLFILLWVISFANRVTRNKAFSSNDCESSESSNVTTMDVDETRTTIPDDNSETLPLVE